METAPYQPQNAIRFVTATSLYDGKATEPLAAFVALSRPFICQPDLPRRWAKGEDPLAASSSCNACFKSALKGGIACAQSG
jgi:2,4-dienoyl-CoA reductase-like NADH-dependent reductase (Old Yellow Enzyme family)